jgi:hypothetical protein
MQHGSVHDGKWHSNRGVILFSLSILPSFALLLCVPQDLLDQYRER